LLFIKKQIAGRLPDRN